MVHEIIFDAALRWFANLAISRFRKVAKCAPQIQFVGAKEKPVASWQRDFVAIASLRIHITELLITQVSLDEQQMLRSRIETLPEWFVTWARRTTSAATAVSRFDGFDQMAIPSGEAISRTV
jgi:hypothetical protein